MQEFNLGAFVEKRAAMRAVREFLQGLKSANLPAHRASSLRLGPSADPSAPSQAGNTSPGGTSLRGDPDSQRSQASAAVLALANAGSANNPKYCRAVTQAFP